MVLFHPARCQDFSLKISCESNWQLGKIVFVYGNSYSYLILEFKNHKSLVVFSITNLNYLKKKSFFYLLGYQEDER